MAFLTKPNKRQIKDLVEKVYAQGSGTMHLENKEWGMKGHLILSIYGGGKRETMHKHHPRELPIIVEFGQCDQKKEYADKDYFDIVESVTSEIMAWLYSEPVKINDCFDRVINQGVRDCEVVKVGRTRVRIEYEMPNAGMMGGWMPILNLFSRKLYYI